jgi:hypothetical protein
MSRHAALVVRRFRGNGEGVTELVRRRARDPAGHWHAPDVRGRFASLHGVADLPPHRYSFRPRRPSHRDRTAVRPGERRRARGHLSDGLAARGQHAGESLGPLPCPPHSAARYPSEAERSAVVASTEPGCTVWGGSRDPRKREACSDKCRAELSRRRRKDAQRTRDEDIRSLLETALTNLKEGAP